VSVPVAGKHIVTKELLNGCICCTLVGSFHAALTEIVQTYHPDRIIIEGSGTSDPAAIALTLDTHPDVKRDGVIVIIDVVNFEGIKDVARSARPHYEFTDLIVFNKVEQVSLEQKQRVVGYVREFHATAPIVEAPGGILRADLAFGIHPWDFRPEVVGSLTHSLTLSSHNASEEMHDHIDAITLTLPETIDVSRLHIWAQQLPREVFRVKGYARTNDNTYVMVNCVNRSLDIQPLDSSPPQPQPRLLCLGFHIHSLENALTKSLAACMMDGP
jgi:G3E family GTPase